MPSPRAILNDITDLGLNPHKKHSSLSKNGKLTTTSASTVLKKTEVKKEIKQHTVVENVLDVSVEENTTQDSVVEVETTTALELKQPSIPEKKKGKFTKKNVTLNND